MRSIPFFDENHPVETIYTDKDDINSELFSSAVFAKEIHSGSIFAVTGPDDGHIVHTDETLITKAPGGFDSIITNVPEIMICITTADCLPLFMYDTKEHAAAITHCGWRGICSGIAHNTVKAMSDLYGSDPSHIICAIGPCICKNCYEVGDELIDCFLRDFSKDETKGFFIPKENGKYLLDMRVAVRTGLTRSGIDPESIRDCGICSFESAKYASYRRDGVVIREKQTVSGIMLKAVNG